MLSFENAGNLVRETLGKIINNMIIRVGGMFLI